MAVYVKRKRADGSFDRGLLPEAGERAVRSPRPPRLRELVGTALAARIAWLVNIKASKSCNCKNLSQQMDLWGIEGCERNRQQIVAHLVGQRDLLSQSFREVNPVASVVASVIPDMVLRFGANWLLDKAIEDVRTNPPQRPCRVKPAKRDPGPRVARPVNQSPRTPKKFLAGLKKEQDRLHALNQQAPKPTPDPFIGEPVLHFGAHLWPVKGNWQWHTNLWSHMPKLINGRCFVGIATDHTTDTFETVKAALPPEFECVEFQNNKEGENHTFRWLQQVVPQGPDDVLIYCHGKGVRAHTAQSEAVRRWSEAMYQTVIFNHDMICRRLAEGYKNCHSFRTFGTRPLSPKYRWHWSGTFFAVRAKYLSGKPVKPHYGGVEAWGGEHFPASESWCEFFDNSMFTTLYDHAESLAIVEPMLVEWNRQQRYERG